MVKIDEMVPPVGKVNPEAVSLSVPRPDIVPAVKVNVAPEWVIVAPEGMESVPVVITSVPDTVKLPLAVTVPPELMVRLLNELASSIFEMPVMVSVEVPAVKVPLSSHEPDAVNELPSAVSVPLISMSLAVIISPPATFG
mgnify:CR=1 FL=1